MTLRVSRRRIPYGGRYHEEVSERVKKGEKIGMVYVSGVEEWECHKCNTKNPIVTFEENHNDAFIPCKGCGVMFVVLKA